MMRIGLIGAGSIGRVHARAVRSEMGSALAGVYDVNPDKARSLADELGVPTFSSLRDFYEASTGVIIASPNRTHAAYACEAMALGRHVLCEKPMAVSMSQADDMRQRAAASSGVHCVGFNYRYLKVFRDVRRRISGGEIGRVLHVDVSFKRSSALTRRAFTWRDDSEEGATSGALGDLGVHLIDMLHFLFGSLIDPGSCQVGLQTKVATKEGREVKVDDHSFVSGRLTGGPSFTLTASKSSVAEETGLTLAVTGSAGDLAYTSRDGQILNRRVGVAWEPVKLFASSRLEDPSGEVTGWADSFLHQLHDWISAVTTRRRPGELAGFEDGYRAQQVLIELLRAGGHVG